ncbi:MAG: hypothetical protein KAS65_13240 [Candidatus Aminicenantes bacterium]|nr:hypothetical protein [Candidatus Aminicenantes bacterium]
MKKIIIILILLLLVVAVYAKKIAQLPELMKPQIIDMSNNNLYVSEGSSIYIYSLKDFSLIKKFGKEGEGPREFKVNPFGPPMIIAVIGDKLYVSSDAKLSTFTLEGEFLSERKVPPFRIFIPVKDKFIASGTAHGDDKKMYLNMGLYDKDLNLIKELYCSDMSIGPNFNWTFPITDFTTLPYQDRIYVVAGKLGFTIDVFDLQGKKLYAIKKKYTPLKVPGDYKDKILKWFKNNSNFKQFYEFFIQRLSFKEQFPPIRTMLVESNRIYVVTYKQKNELSEIIIMDLKGKELKQKYVPIVGIPGNLLDSPIFTIKNQQYYTLIENDDEEIWELHRVDLK